MKVDFNNLRIQLAYAYDKVCRQLNDNIDENGDVVIPAIELQDRMDELRRLAIMPCHVYREDDPDFISLSDKITDIAHFNPEEVV